MKKLLLFLLVIMMPAWTNADGSAFSGKNNSVQFSVMQGNDWDGLLAPPSRFVPLTKFDFTYSQPNSVFRLPGRQNVGISWQSGWWETDGENWREYENQEFFISEDAFLYNGQHSYFAIGMGIGMRNWWDNRVGSLMVFHFSGTFGVRLSDGFNLELFYLHYSNGHTEPPNPGLNYYGASVVRKF